MSTTHGAEMTAPERPQAPRGREWAGADPARAPATGAALVGSLVRLARPHQWAKSVFVLAGPAYGLADLVQSGQTVWHVVWPALLAAAAFALAASGCYVLNDLADREQDRAHPRKRRRPLASGEVTPRQALWFAAGLFVCAFALLLPIEGEPRWWAMAALFVYVANVTLYSAALKKHAIADVMGLSLGFVLRVLGGCAAVGIGPSTWLLNCTLFLAMFLSFGKRLGERRSMGQGAAAVREVQSLYTDTLLEMSVVVTGVATLITYTVYVDEQADHYMLGFNLLWLTVIPATFVLMRCVVLLDAGRYDDPTEIALRDRAVRGGTVLFAAVTAFLVGQFRLGWFG